MFWKSKLAMKISVNIKKANQDYFKYLLEIHGFINLGYSKILGWRLVSGLYFMSQVSWQAWILFKISGSFTSHVGRSQQTYFLLIFCPARQHVNTEATKCSYITLSNTPKLISSDSCCTERSVHLFSCLVHLLSSTHFQFSFLLLVPLHQSSKAIHIFFLFHWPSVIHSNLWITSSAWGKFSESQHWMAKNIENRIRVDSYIFLFSSKYFRLWNVILLWFSPSCNSRNPLNPDSVSKRVYCISLWDPIPFR